MYQVPTAARWRKRKNAPSLRLPRIITGACPVRRGGFFYRAKACLR
jgi:hypothetical protein